MLNTVIVTGYDNSGKSSLCRSMAGDSVVPGSFGKVLHYDGGEVYSDGIKLLLEDLSMSSVLEGSYKKSQIAAVVVCVDAELFSTKKKSGNVGEELITLLNLANGISSTADKFFVVTKTDKWQKYEDIHPTAATNLLHFISEHEAQHCHVYFCSSPPINSKKLIETSTKDIDAFINQIQGNIYGSQIQQSRSLKVLPRQLLSVISQTISKRLEESKKQPLPAGASSSVSMPANIAQNSGARMVNVFGIVAAFLGSALSVAYLGGIMLLSLPVLVIAVPALLVGGFALLAIGAFGDWQRAKQNGQSKILAQLRFFGSMVGIVVALTALLLTVSAVAIVSVPLVMSILLVTSLVVGAVGIITTFNQQLHRQSIENDSKDTATHPLPPPIGSSAPIALNVGLKVGDDDDDTEDDSPSTTPNQQ